MPYLLPTCTHAPPAVTVSQDRPLYLGTRVMMPSKKPTALPFSATTALGLAGRSCYYYSTASGGGAGDGSKTGYGASHRMRPCWRTRREESKVVVDGR